MDHYHGVHNDYSQLSYFLELISYSYSYHIPSS